MSNIVIFGKTGQIGRALLAIYGDNAIGISRDEADLSDVSALGAVMDHHRPAVIINAAAYTQVDHAESEPDIAYAVNAEAPGRLAELAAARHIPFVHYSTDYVFDGSGDAPRNEQARCAPLNAYGVSKRAGEEAVMQAGGQYLIFRTSWVYDAVGKNFFNTMLRLGSERETLRVVADQIGAPSYAPDLASATMRALDMAQQAGSFPSGLYHLCHRGQTSWHGFAEAIFAAARQAGLSMAIRACLPIASSDYPVPAARPHNSRLDCSMLREVFGITMPSWQDGLRDAMRCNIIFTERKPYEGD